MAFKYIATPTMTSWTTRSLFAVRRSLGTNASDYGFRSFATSRVSQASNAETKVSDRFGMDGKSVLITGGARGMGLGIAKAIAQMGGNVAVLDINEKPEAEFDDFASKYGVKTVYKRADITRQDSLEPAFKEIVDELPGLNGLVTAAGICIDKPIGEHGFEETKAVQDVNILGTLWPVKLLADHLYAQNKPGSIVMIASVAAHG